MRSLLLGHYFWYDTTVALSPQLIDENTRIIISASLKGRWVWWVPFSHFDSFLTPVEGESSGVSSFATKNAKHSWGERCSTRFEKQFLVVGFGSFVQVIRKNATSSQRFWQSHQQQQDNQRITNILVCIPTQTPFAIPNIC